jgi:DNA-binding CsgD family transcriptional regulator
MHGLLEREAALACLHEYADQARGGDGRLVLIAGEAGVGKSTLVERFAEELSDARWWWGACDGLFTPRPLAPLFDLADQLDGELARLCHDGADRPELFQAVLSQVGRADGLDVVVIEDVHWADEATLDLLRYMGRRLRNAALLLLITYRDDALTADHPLRVVLGDLAFLRSSRRVGLAPLSASAVEVLAGGSGLPAAELHRLTGGNPFYVTEVLRCGMAQVPPSARDAVLARAARLSPETRAVLDLAAITGTRVEVELLSAVVDIPATAMDELLDSGLLVDDATELRFRHEIGRLAVAQALPTHRSRALHQRLLVALAAHGCDDDARMAFHAEEAGDAAAVVRYAPAAGRRAARMASHREAAAQFERALRYAHAADSATVAELNEAFADEAVLLDRWDEADAAAQRALDLWRGSGVRLREGDGWRRLSRIRWNRCLGDEAVAAAQNAVATLEPLGPSIELARVYATFANQRMLHADHDRAIDLARRAQVLAEGFAANDIVSDALITQAVSSSSLDMAWDALMARGLDIALTGGHHDQAARAYANLAAIHSDQRRFADAERILADGLAYCDDHDLTTYGRCLRIERCGVLERTGRWDDAVAEASKLLERSGASPANRLCLLIRLGVLRARRGEPGVWAYLDEAVTTAAAGGEPQNLVAVHLARAEAHWLAEENEAARHEAEMADDTGDGASMWHRGEVAVWLARTGSPRPVRRPLPEPHRLFVDGDTAAAAECWTALGSPYEAALAQSESSGEQQLRAALSALTGLGADPAARIVQRRLRASGARSVPAGPQAATRSHPWGLTRREHQILELIGARYTNAEIAAKLFISARTVDHHVSAILAKLDVPTRAAAAHKAARAAGAK